MGNIPVYRAEEEFDPKFYSNRGYKMKARFCFAFVSLLDIY